MDLFPTIRTSRQTAPRNSETGFQHDGNPIGRLIAKIAREVRPSDGFEDYGEAKAAIRKRLTSLGIRYTQAQFDDALSLVETNTPLVARATPGPSRLIREVATETGVISPAAAKRIVDELHERTGLRMSEMPTGSAPLSADAINQFKRDNGLWRR
jgi:outer membrane translocation and assembly module TamA